MHRLLVAGMAGAMALAGLAADLKLVYYSTLDSLTDITTPKVGPAGTVSAGVTYVDGKVGKAIKVMAGFNGVVTSLPKGSIGSAGTIEMWARIDNASARYGVTRDPKFYHIGSSTLATFLNICANDGCGHSGICAQTMGGGVLFTNSSCGDSGSYADLPFSGDEKSWHHYAVVWDKNGISGVKKACALYIDGVMRSTADWSNDSVVTYFANNAISVQIGDYNTSSGCSIDEFKIWDGAKTTFDINPTTTPSVSSVTAKQHYPWCGKIDIGYTVAGATDGLVAKITVKDNANNVTYEAKTFDVAPTATVGSHAVVWDATTDGVNKMSTNMVATVSLIVPEN